MKINRLVSNKSSLGDAYSEKLTYDQNGNIKTYLRNAITPMDNMTYYYIPNTNKLDHIKDDVASSEYAEDIDDQSAGNYQYDAIGNLISDKAEGLIK